MCKITIIMPVYNVENYLKETLESLDSQSLKDFELIAIDDGSKDKSYDILMEFSKKDNRIKAFKSENTGVSHTRNKALEMARGEFIVFMDSDDILPMDSLKDRYEKIIQEQADIVVGGTNRFNREKEWRMERHFLEEGEKSLLKNLELLKNLGPCNKIYRSSLLKGLFFNENIDYAEDVAFVMEALLKAKKIYAIDKMVYKYRDREESLTSLKGRANIVMGQAIESYFYVADIIDRNVDDKNLKKAYFERVIDVDLWKTFKEAMGDKGEVIKATKNLEKLFVGLDRDIFNNSEKLRVFIVKNLYENYSRYLENREVFKEMLEATLNRGDSVKYLELEKLIKKCLKGNSKNSLKIYLIKNKLTRLFK